MQFGPAWLKKELLEATRQAKAKGLKVTYLEFDQPGDDEEWAAVGIRTKRSKNVRPGYYHSDPRGHRLVA